MITKDNLQQWINSGKDFILLRLPGDSNVVCYTLGKSKKEIGQNEVLVCSFESTSPAAFSIVGEIKLSLDAVTSLHIDLPDNTDSTTSTTEAGYINQVNKALQAISSGNLQKVVVAQTHWLSSLSYNPIEAFQSACNSNDTYAYLARIGGEHWLGSSPELLLKSDYKISETVALAGTRLVEQSDKDWGAKEVVEQSIVGAYAEKTFKKNGFTSVSVGKPFTKTVGHIQHICNLITAQNPAKLDWRHVLQDLHPTPALAGFPKDGAKAFIKTQESFTRGLYGGFIGYKNEEGVELFVNIRCAKLFKNSAQLFAGAGINSDSDPESEWVETNNKLDVIRSILS